MAQNTLFNHKTIEKLSEDVQIKPLQQKAAKKWLKFLNSDKSEKEKSNYLQFEQSILYNILGYTVDDLKFEENGIEYQIHDKNNKSVLCIEIKGADVNDLWKRTKTKDSAVDQLWGYMNDIVPQYGLCTNYNKFILFDRNKGSCQYYEFDFQSINDNEYRLKEFVWMFSKENLLLKKSPETTLIKSIEMERDLEEEFYDIYHQTRMMLIKEFEAKTSKNVAIEQAQMFLNRLIFIMFAEDHNFVDKHILRNQIKLAIETKEINDESTTIFNTIQKIFQWFATGHSKPDVFSFNGGLFANTRIINVQFPDKRHKNYFKNTKRKNQKFADKKSDQFLDKISNINPIIKNILDMDSYDFESDLTVNILGHIFEQSIDDLEKLQNVNQYYSERKEMGIYYTPPYITDYICRQTILPYLSKTNTLDVYKLVKEYADENDLDTLENKFKSIKILDPACGSGAFLVKAVEILFEIHQEIQFQKELEGNYEVNVKGKKGKIVRHENLHKYQEQGVMRQIIEDNIYGVDINEQSVDISKIAMFFKITDGKRALPDLSKNIKRGNTILGKNTPDGEQAFDWSGQNGFPQVCSNKDNVVGVIPGFDIIIGNPPYVRQERTKNKDCMQLSISNTLKGDLSIDKRADKSSYFYYHCLNWLKKNGRLGFIITDSWLSHLYGQQLRKMLLENCSIDILLKFDYRVFKNISIKPIITIITKNIFEDNKVQITTAREGDLLLTLQYQQKNQKSFTTEKWTDYFNNSILEPKIGLISLNELGCIFRGVTTNFNNYFVMDKETIHKYNIHEKFIRPIIPKNPIEGELVDSDINRYLFVVDKPKKDLLRDPDATGVIKYIKDGENKKFLSNNQMLIPAQKPTLRKNILWYSVRMIKLPIIFMNAIIDNRHKIIVNNGKFYALDTWVCFIPHNVDDLHVILALIRSSWFSICIEKAGHPMGGGALKMQIVDYKSMLVPDISKLSKNEKTMLSKAWSSYLVDVDQKRLDDVVFVILGLENEQKKICDILEKSIQKRKQQT